MGRHMTGKSAAPSDAAHLADRLTHALEFYRELGFDALPFRYEPPDPRLTGICPPAEHDGSSGVMDKHSLMTALREEIGDCRRCKLCTGRTHIVFGEGNVNTALMFVGEAPGREEDTQGRPFVGDAGKILTSLITRMGKEDGFGREDVYIANIVKCRPPMNRDPEPDEIGSCLPFLNRQIEIISPEVIICLGRVSTHTLLGIKGPLSRLSITKVRGQFHEYRVGEKRIALMPTFHPAYLLRNPKDKWLTWEDAQAVLRRLKEKGH